MSKVQIIFDHISGHNRMQKVLSQLSEEQVSKIKVLGEWSVKDIIAHLTGWHLIEASEIQRLRNGIYPETIGITDEKMHQINAENVQKRKDMKVPEVIKEWEDSFEKVKLALEQASDEEFTKEVSETGKENTSIQKVFSYRYEGEEHTTAHAKQIEEFFGLSR